ncbi:(d)CMP kinase [Bacillus timonensis]|uniref:Cytidylate kinase n=1 Tax=Bacillus timonensis TaxID=1033734 RepID=A0A4S3PN80_9BACI|nr:(d)CMP kinase [Bacillus timonensis]THE11021.1 (d)CMP kinase [Bacillus timonensis]
MEEKKNIAIAIDGPAGAGKSTVAKLIAAILSYTYIDTGAMYRALTLNALNHNIDLEDEERLLHLLLHTEIELSQKEKEQIVLLDEVDVTNEIRSKKVTAHVPFVAKHPSIREEMVKRQQTLAENRGVVMDGRDIGTYVLPNAEVKIFLVASVEERAKRRQKENIQKGISTDLEELKSEIEKRDLMDSKREVAPLVKAEDAVELNTTNLSIDEVVQKILEESFLKS